jgi:hypothetical protein
MAKGPNFSATSLIFQTLPKARGANSPNLVTLVAQQATEAIPSLTLSRTLQSNVTQCIQKVN